jgi:heme/copper-type cytochrome/quinol oxidase subunit 3
VTVAESELVESAGSTSLEASDVGLSFSRRLRRYRLGLGLCICAILMLFASFFSAYLVRKGVANYDYAAQSYSTEWQRLELPTLLLSMATGLLLFASAGMELARRKALRAASQLTVSGDRRYAVCIWFAAVCTSGFLITLAATWHLLRSDGHGIGSGAQASFFYLLSGVHSLHIAVGLLLVGYFGLRRKWRTGEQTIAVDLGAWYWHSMNVLWLCIMLLMFL